MGEILTKQEFSELIGFEKECRCDECAHVRSKAVTSHEALRARVVELEKDAADAKNALMVSEHFRRAYSEGKYKLYSMGGDICEAAANHLPCSEGPLERYTAKIEREHSPRLVEQLREIVAHFKLVEEERDAAMARVVELEAEVRAGSFTNQENLTIPPSLAVKLLAEERDVANRRADKATALAEERTTELLSVIRNRANIIDQLERRSKCVTQDKYKEAIQRGDSNYAAFEQEQKSLGECRQRLATAEEDYEGLWKFISDLDAILPTKSTDGSVLARVGEAVEKLVKDREHLRKMLDALPVERAEELVNVFLDRYSDVVKAELRAYAQVARGAQASLSGAEDPKPYPRCSAEYRL